MVNLESHQDINAQIRSVNLGVNLKEHGARYILRLKEGKVLPQTVIDDVVQETTLLTNHVANVIRERIKSRYEKNCAEVGENPDFVRNLLEDDALFQCDVFEGLQTGNDQKKFFRENFGFVQPTAVPLTSKQIWKKRSRRFQNKTSFGYTIDFNTTLRRLLNNNEFAKDFFRDKETDENFHDLCDGDIFKNHPTFKRHPNAAQIILYYDDVTLTNPLSSKVHKVGFFYSVLSNTSIKLRSYLPVIQLVAVAKTSDIRTPDNLEKILSNFIDSTVELDSEDGLIVNENLNIHGALLAFVGDTLASNFIGGFKESVGGAFRKCRYCMASKDDIQNFFLEESFQRRTLTEHLNHCRQAISAFWSKQFGVTHLSCLQKCPHFDVTSMLPFDAMHVILEGGLPYELNLFLFYCILDKKFFTVEQFNNRLEGFPYSYLNVASKPSPLRKSHLTKRKKNALSKQNASQCWLLCRMLPFLIDDLIPHDDPMWQCMLMHLDIANHLLQREFSGLDLHVLTENISAHHEKFKNLYPDESITPKLHYYIHLPTTIRNYGPLLNIWCIRFEAKHRKFKRADK
eukprot:Pompholyxophrys_punicea_v1_NODE_302_length_2323_cov_4.263228.p1 type:complete len:570 gc:universal NODE_302_length_2323_cov_4.263228:2225-516(-)